MPQNSTSRPFVTWAREDSEGLRAPLPAGPFPAGRRLPDGGVFTLERPDDPRDPGDDEREPLSDM